MFDRTIKLIGPSNYQKIKNSHILVLGLGGVGGYAIETLIRSGLENITIVDYDEIDVSNINRQIIALSTNIGTNKVEAWQERIHTINSSVNVKVINEKITSTNIDLLFQDKYDFIIDACDTLTVKQLLIKKCQEQKINLITICGMGKRLNPTLVQICDIRNTSYDPLAKALRKYVKDEDVNGKVTCVFSSEKPSNNKDKVIASMMMVPATAGILSASYCIDKIIKKENT